MTDIVKQLAPTIWDQIQKSQKILLHCHPGPDGDSVGSSLAMMHALKAIGKQATLIMGDSEPPHPLSHLPGFGDIVIKNLFQIDLAQFDLFLILDSSSPGQISQRGKIKFPDSLNTIIIDHHATDTKFAKLNLVDATYSAVAQIVYDLFKIWNVKISREIAICLYVGIYTDTGGFKYPLTTYETFLISAELIKDNPDFTRDIFYLDNSYEPQHIAYIGLALNSVEHFFSNHVAISLVPYAELNKHGIRKTHTEKMDISNLLKSVEGWMIGIAFSEAEKDVVNLSFRTRDSQKYDVSKIAFATGSGGGHPAAAGATLRMSFDQAKSLLLETISKVYPELGSP